MLQEFNPSWITLISGLIILATGIVGGIHLIISQRREPALPIPQPTLPEPAERSPNHGPEHGPGPVHYFLDIRLSGASEAVAHAGAQTSAGMHRLEALRLGEAAEVAIGGKGHALGALVRRLLAFEEGERVLDDRGQLEIGRYLYAETIARLPWGELRKLRETRAVILHIGSPDEHITRLPWVLLARGQELLCNCGWSVLLSGRPFAEADDNGEYRLQPPPEMVELPPSPRLLVIAPQPKDAPPTEASAHLDRLQALLREGDRRLIWGQNLRRADGWEEFVTVLPAFAPHLVYFYGHGAGSEQRADLLFQDNEGRRLDVPMVDFAQCINGLESPPRLVYVNCCQGDAAGLLGAGRQINAPAVLTNRTVAAIPAAISITQTQAMAVWESIILKGEAPHTALQQVYLRTAELKLSRADVRWMTPVLYGDYREWRANPAPPAKRYVKDPDWHLKVDRIGQFATVSHLAREMLRNQRPRCLFFIWYGKAGEGIELFHERLEKDLEGDLPDRAELYTVRPAWPEALTDPEIAFREVVTEAFDVADVTQVPGRIRERTQGESGRRTLTYVSHLPMETGRYESREMLEGTINPTTLGDYFDWCDRVYEEQLETGQHVLVGISFLVKDPPRFRAWIERELERLELRNSVVKPLDEMERLAEGDLRDFMDLHNIPIPAERRNRIIKAILAKTKGHYELTIAQLEDWLARGLAQGPAVEEEGKDEDGFRPFEV
ncbi:MAG: hypothetical protein BECKG1743D_GA0114223_102872 [Candidatus Kentron sp. G]|nr:MAG: hypothetical protein BECKG1743F_GA0114225_103362 [Candidatus Kentron sp. G]VFM99811.1 MAG: hypothetical protein BECKG1743E_GA0114224_102833 [Candidatus Kentron sp. G]VFN01517.1 MAG: hypothetical protein BECKG1743D_GA0114223_102872 [Candidatus Kentron sp. G]